MQTGRSVLVIEDFPVVREALCSILASDGFEVCGFDNGADAVAAAEEKEFDIIITDYRMPNMNGLDATRRLRSRFPLSVIIGVSSEDLEEDFLAAGADGFLLKPYKYDNLLKLALKN